MNPIIEETLRLWRSGRKVKNSQAGWLSGNAVCCQHRGESVDKRMRAGVITSDGNISYSCFNCQFTASYKPGRYLSYKYRKLLEWLGANQSDIDRLVIEALRIKETINPEDIVEQEVLPTYPEIALPEGSLEIWEWLDYYTLSNKPYTRQFMDAVEYLSDRKISLKDYQFYLTEDTTAKMNQRVIIPFNFKKKLVGYTARLISDGNPKYYTQGPSNFVFNIDKQRYDSKFVIVCEGPFDAMSLDGVAVLGNDLSDSQADIIDSLEREVIVVADSDNAGKKLMKHALEYGWSISFPPWREKAKDINEAVVKYGKLYVLKSILEYKETNQLKIKLRMRGLEYA